MGDLTGIARGEHGRARRRAPYTRGAAGCEESPFDRRRQNAANQPYVCEIEHREPPPECRGESSNDRLGQQRELNRIRKSVDRRIGGVRTGLRALSAPIAGCAREIPTYAPRNSPASVHPLDAAGFGSSCGPWTGTTYPSRFTRTCGKAPDSASPSRSLWIAQ